MMFLYGLHCVALFLGYCVLICAALLILGAVAGYIQKQGRKGKNDDKKM